jgi:hypothetical protein
MSARQPQYLPGQTGSEFVPTSLIFERGSVMAKMGLRALLVTSLLVAAGCSEGLPGPAGAPGRRVRTDRRDRLVFNGPFTAAQGGSAGHVIQVVVPTPENLL